MNEKDDKEGNVEVRDRSDETRGQAPSQGHDPVTKVVWMARTTPPARCDELSPRRRRHELEVAGIPTLAEFVLLAIGSAENVVADEIERKDGSGRQVAQLDGHKCQETSLKTVDEGHPGQVAHREHESKSIGGDVHLGEDGLLIEDCIKDVPIVEKDNKDHAVGDAALARDVLVACTAEVEETPEDHARPQLVEGLDVKDTDPWVELSANEPVEKVVARVAALRQELALGEAEAVDVE